MTIKIDIQKKCQRFSGVENIEIPSNVFNGDKILIYNQSLRQFSLCTNIDSYVKQSANICRRKRQKTTLMKLLTHDNTVFTTYDDIEVVKNLMILNRYEFIKLNEKDYTYIYHRIHTSSLNKINQKGVYVILNKSRKEIYIGSTNRSFLQRWKDHILKPNVSNTFIKDNDSIFYVVYPGKYDKDTLLSLESKLINHYIKLKRYKVLNKVINF